MAGEWCWREAVCHPARNDRASLNRAMSIQAVVLACQPLDGRCRRGRYNIDPEKALDERILVRRDSQDGIHVGDGRTIAGNTVMRVGIVYAC